MLISKTTLIINIVLICVSIAVISASSYGLGKSEVDKTSAAYISSTTFLSISVVLAVVFIMSLVILTVLSTGWTGGATIGITGAMGALPQGVISSPQFAFSRV